MGVLRDAITETCDHGNLVVTQSLRQDVRNLIEPVLNGEQNVELTAGNNTAEIQQKISKHPKECLKALIKDVSDQYIQAYIAYDMSVQAMDTHLDAALQSSNEALYKVALERDLSNDDLTYAFGDDFITEMESREQMQQAEKNTDDPNLE